VNELEEEVKFLKILLQVSYEYMTKMLAEELAPGVKGELQKVLHLIQKVNGPPQQEESSEGNMTMSELRNNQGDLSRQSELVVVEERSAKHLKGSLISDASSRDRDTIYSYFEQDETLEHEGHAT